MTISDLTEYVFKCKKTGMFHYEWYFTEREADLRQPEMGWRLIGWTDRKAE
jgi:hypothetical protein